MAVNKSKEQLQDLIAAVTAGAAAAAGAAGGAGGVAGTISAASLAGPMWAGTLEARENHLKEELEEVRRLRQVGNYSGRHKGEGEKDQCPRCTYERHKAGQRCPAEDRPCKGCGEKGHFRAANMCTKKKKKTTRRRKEEPKDTSSESSSDDEEEKEVNRVVQERVGPGTRDKARKKGTGHGTHENKPSNIIQAEYVNKIGKEDQQQDAKTITGKDNNTKDTTARDTNAKDGYKRPTEEQEKENEGNQGGGEKSKDRGAGPVGKVKDSAAKGASGSNTGAQGAGLDGAVKGGAAEGAKGSNTESSDTKDINAKDTTAKDNTAKDTNGSDSYPLVDPRPEEAPDNDYSSLEQSTGTDGSTAHTIGVINNQPHTQHLKDEKPHKDQDATNPGQDIPHAKNATTKTTTAEHIIDMINKHRNSQHQKDEERHNDQDAIDPGQDIRHAKNATAKTITTEDNTVKEGNGEHNDANDP